MTISEVWAYISGDRPIDEATALAILREFLEPEDEDEEEEDED